jgi:hypothetical protein
MAVVLAEFNYEAEHGDDTWKSCPEDARPGWIRWGELMADALTAAGFGPVKAAAAGALRDAADELARLSTIGRTPYAECTTEERESYSVYVHGTHEQWLRSRAAIEIELAETPVSSSTALKNAPVEVSKAEN